MAAPDGVDEERWQICLDLARDLLLVDENGADLKHRYLRVLIDEDLPKPTTPLRVLIVGAGIAGLSAAHLLKQAGHQVRLLEANTQRIGGRIKTFRHDPERGMTSPFSDPQQYAEAGAMRIPDSHPLTLALVDRFGLPRRPFYNVDVDPSTGRPLGAPPPVVYTSITGETWRNGPDTVAGPTFEAPVPAGRTWVNVNGIQIRRSEYQQDPAAINKSFTVDDHFSRTAGDSYGEALRLADEYHLSLTGAEQIDGWARLIYDLDHLSMNQYLSQIAGLDSEEIDAIGTLENITSRMPLSFIHSYLARSMINPDVRYWEIEGGSWRLPYAFESLLDGDISFDRRVIDVDHDATGPSVSIDTISEDGRTRETFTGDVAILTVPFSSLRHVRMKPPLSYPKRRAVIELHYDSATKVLLEFSQRWWEFTESDWKRELDALEPGLYERQVQPADEIFGGGSVTDNPNRFAYYPSHPVPGRPGGVVLASYTWADDAARWDSMDEHDRYTYALRGLQDLHGDRIALFYTGRGATQSWARDDYAFGEAAVFSPGQFTEHHPVIPLAEGALHFAGEHTSLKHSWIEGALESGVRVALEVTARASGEHP